MSTAEKFEVLQAELDQALAEILKLKRQLQHQGEPVTLPVRKHETGDVEYDERNGAAIDAWNACLDEIAKLGPLYAHPVQGEPVALPDQKELVKAWGHDMGGNYEEGQAFGWNAFRDEIAKLGPLYTHADPAEVERLSVLVRGSRASLDTCALQIESLQAQLADVTTQRDRLRDGLDNANINIANWAKSDKDLRAQLAEAQALLEEALGSVYVDAGRCESGAEHRDLLKLSERIKANLSASAEPNWPCNSEAAITDEKGRVFWHGSMRDLKAIQRIMEKNMQQKTPQ